MKFTNRYANADEVREVAFRTINRTLAEFSEKHGCPDLSADNRKRFPWFAADGDSHTMPASRHWEYPWAIIESRVSGGMKVCDIGCGRTPFMFLLADLACAVTAVDPQIGTTPDGGNFGIPSEWVKRFPQISFVRGTLEETTLPDDAFDRVYCISVIEHLNVEEDRRRGMREIARILKPGGLAVLTVDCIPADGRFTNFLELVHASGLILDGYSDFTLPREPFATTEDGVSREEVFGFVLRKEPSAIRYPTAADAKAEVRHHDLPFLRNKALMQTIKRDLTGAKGGRVKFFGLFKFLGKLMVGRYRGFFESID
ncbi:MAG: hypothetical protein A2Z34_07680 [Planctomycetes bacterium RBG_16_59_8]|nr:MAG: hypothetical protein A2Z34_07680 [Planctomycetes bacterium RBG_16_59_8]